MLFSTPVFAQVTADVSGLALASPDPRLIAARIVRVGLSLIGIVFVTLIIYGGFLWMTAAGNEEQIDRARKFLRNAIIGLIIILSALGITQFIISRLTAATRGGISATVLTPSGICPPYCPSLRGAFYVRAIQPPDNSPSPTIRNAVLKVTFSRRLNSDSVNPESVRIFVQGDGGEFQPVGGGDLRTDGSVVEYRPPTECPSPPMPSGRRDRCFEANRRYRVELVSGSAGLKDAQGQQLVCRGLPGIRQCSAEFEVGELMDFAPPEVEIQWPKDTGVAANECIAVQARVSDDSGVARVVFYADGDQIDSEGDGGIWIPPSGTVVTEGIAEIPCWPTEYPAPSRHTLTARAFDLDDNQATSGGARVWVRPAHCFDGALNDDEDGIDCDFDAEGPSGCGLCDGRACTEAAQCAGGACVDGKCASETVITGVSPGDGRAGTFVTVAGNGFGATAGTVTFTDNQIATAPQACAGATTWSDHCALVGVPEEASTGAIGLMRAGCAADDTLCRDTTDDERGPVVPRQNFDAQNLGGQAPQDGSFWVNDVAHPGLCALRSPPENKAEGRWGTRVDVSGVQFGARRGRGNLFFGSARVPGVANWSDTGVQAAVPSVAYGVSQVQLVNDAGAPSNALPYDVLSPDAGSLPFVERVVCAGAAPENPARAGSGAGCTIFGRNFGDEPGLVWFLAPDGRSVRGDVSFPTQCETGWWSKDSITVRVPEIRDVSDLDLDRDIREFLSGDAHIYIVRYDAQQSNLFNFTLLSQLNADPFLACIKPGAGPLFTNVSLYGERLGAKPARPDEGVHFTDRDASVRISGAPGWSFTSPAALQNVGGVRGDRCPQGGWSPSSSESNTICAQVPERAAPGAPAGPVVVRNTIDNLTRMSNSAEFLVGDCRLEQNDPSYLACDTLGLNCCGDGSCRKQCAPARAAESAYGWQFTTTPAPLIPKVLEQCDTAEGEGHPLPELTPPSPAPAASSGRGRDTDVCVNAAVSARFTEAVDPQGLNASNILVERCTGTEELVAAADSTFDDNPVFWSRPPEPDFDGAPAHEDYLRIERIESEGCRINECNREEDDPEAHALRLEKLNDDTGPGWRDARGLQQNYEHWFGYQLNANLDTDGKTYTASAWVRATDQSALSKRVGILLQREGGAGGMRCGGVMEGSTCATDDDCLSQADVARKACTPTPGFWQKFSQEETIQEIDQWKRVSVTGAFDSGPNSNAPGFVRVFMEGLAHDVRLNPPAADPRELFSVFVDQVRVEGDVCRNVAPLSFDQGIRQIHPDNRGFQWSPPGGEFAGKSWYRVALRGGSGGISAQSIGNQQGQPMAVLSDAAVRCGHSDAAYCFRFQTKESEERCTAGGVAVVPPRTTVTEAVAEVNYWAAAVALGDPCLVLNQGRGWSWESSDPARASVEFALGNVGRRCTASADCAIDECSEGFCTGMPWTTTAKALDENATDASGRAIPIEIRASTPAAPPRATGHGELFVEFLSPEVVAYWPTCGEACTNAALGVQFSTAMRANSTDTGSVTNTENVELWAISCGNGIKEAGEDCDDGNTINGDGCLERCLNEGSNFALRCGNGRIDTSEDCDDGNIINGDGCSDRCLNEGVAPGSWVVGALTGNCGNGTREFSGSTGVGEECDDGNTQDNDGCSARCQNEGTRSDLAVCGNHRLDRGEECERSSNGEFSAWCDSQTCLRRGPAISGQCGNGRIDPGEECDPNLPLLDTGDKKALCQAANCQWTGTQKPSALARPGCGNGRIDLGEDCDDGAARDDDGCSKECENEGSVSATVAACGNGVVEWTAGRGGEECDDGNTVDGDGCSARCLNEGRPSARCGNNAVETGEDCDDGNTAAGDGCGAQCLREGVPRIGRPPQRIEGIALSWSNVLNTLTIKAPLQINTNYRVLIRGGEQGVRSCRGESCEGLGKPIADNPQTATRELNFLHGWGSANPPPSLGERCPSAFCNAFSWTFKTKDQECVVDRVEVLPPEAALYVVGARQRYESQPYGPPDSCEANGQRLDPFLYRWGWLSSDTDVAEVTNRNSIPGCGNGILESGEDCDDGNLVGADGCSSTCLNEGSDFAPSCGNGIVETPQEECEPVEAGGDVFCTARCINRGSLPCGAPDAALCCGNRLVECGEDCDDGNLAASDGCGAQCLREGGAPGVLCGNGTVDLGEECDPENAATAAFCNPESCLRRGTPPRSVCGNGALEHGEDCDDRNTADGDGCGSTCLNEGSQAVSSSRCGNGILERGEDCDDGNTEGRDGCSGTEAARHCVHEQVGERGSVGLATLPEDPPRVDPVQDAIARGIKKFCRPTAGPFPSDSNLVACVSAGGCGEGQICAPPNPWSIADISATAQNKTGSAPLTVYCVARTDLDCPYPEGQSGYTGTGNTSVGRGSDSCCYARPAVNIDSRTPTGNDACRNALIRANFTQLLDPQSLVGNVGIARAYTGKQGCPAGSREVLPDGRIVDLESLLRNGSFEQEEQEGNVETDEDDIAWWSVVQVVPSDYSGVVPAMDIQRVPSRPPEPGDPTAGIPDDPGLPARQGAALLSSSSDEGSYPKIGIEARQQVTLEANTRYRLSAWVLPEVIDPSPSNPFVLGVRKERASGQPVFLETTVPPLTTAKLPLSEAAWRMVTLEFQSQEAGQYGVFFGNYGADTLHIDEVRLERVLLAQSGGFGARLSRIMDRVLSWLARAVPGARAQALRSTSAPTLESSSADTWCITADLTVSAETITVEEPALISGMPPRLVSQVTLRPSRALDPQARYKVVFIGDRVISDAQVVGIRSASGVGFHPRGSGGVDQSWQFRTGKDICALDEVQVTGGDTLTFTGDLRWVYATAYHRGPTGLQPIQPVSGYEWIWDWRPAVGDDPPNPILEVSEDPDNNGRVHTTQVAIAKDQSGIVDVFAKVTIISDTARAGSVIAGSCALNPRGVLRCRNRPEQACTVDADCASETGRMRQGSTQFTVMLCDNPWPRDLSTSAPRRFADDGSDPLITPQDSPITNFSTWYCRDAGEDGEEDDLPALNFPPAVLYEGGEAVTQGGRYAIASAYTTLSGTADTKAEEAVAKGRIAKEAEDTSKAARAAAKAAADAAAAATVAERAALERVAVKAEAAAAEAERIAARAAAEAEAAAREAARAAAEAEAAMRTALLKEFLLTTPDGKEAIGLRVLSNPTRLSARAWYDAMGFRGKPEPVDRLDGYETIRDGNTLYIAAPNVVFLADDIGGGATVYGNIYVVSLSEGAALETREIFDQLTRNLLFNVNITNEDKAKMRRDLQRIADMEAISRALEVYANPSSGVRGYPTLPAGTFIRSMSTSRWPSWNQTLGAVLGVPLPQDPINNFGAECVAQSGEQGSYDTATCWNEKTQTYRCPADSRVYHYRAIGTASYELGVDFERLLLPPIAGEPIWSVAGFSPAAIKLRVSGNCAWTWSNNERICGNGIVEQGEVCEVGQSEAQTVRWAGRCSSSNRRCDPVSHIVFDNVLNRLSAVGATCSLYREGSCVPRRSCSLNPSQACSADDDCSENEGICILSSQCQAVRTCTSTCRWDSDPEQTQWNPWIPDLDECNVPICGNGIREGSETCDDGARNGQYGRCNSDCTGIGDYCGDDVRNGPEACDDGSDNGLEYNGENSRQGWCRFDCSGYGPHCGDGVVQAPDEQCERGVERSPGRCRAAGALTPDACSSDADCADGQTCALCETRAYPMYYERSCIASRCGWGGWSDSCVRGDERCGDGIVQTAAGEECDEGTANDGQNDEQENADGCTNSCQRATCGDGFNQGRVCTAGSAAMRGRTCATSQQCGAGGVCQDVEECDAGANNGVQCIPSYGSAGCTYCDRQCNVVTRTGGFCGDRERNGPDQCDGTITRWEAESPIGWLCAGTPGISERFWGFANEAEINAWNLIAGSTVTHSPGGYNESASAMGIRTTGGTFSVFNVHGISEHVAGFVGIDVADIQGRGEYRALAYVRAVDSATAGKRLRLILRRAAEGSSASSFEITLTREWQQVSVSRSFPASSTDPIRIGIILPEVGSDPSDPAYNVLVDNVSLWPIANPTCGDSGANACRALCAAGNACEQFAGDADQDQDGDKIADRCDNDDDGDGYLNNVDIDDRNPEINPDAPEVGGWRNDGVDNNSNGLVDEYISFGSNPLRIIDSGNQTTDQFWVFIDEQPVHYIVPQETDARWLSFQQMPPGFHRLRVEVRQEGPRGMLGRPVAMNNFRIEIPSSVTIEDMISTAPVDAPGRTASGGYLPGGYTIWGPVGSAAEFLIKVGSTCAEDADCASGGENYTCIAGWCQGI